MKWHLTLLGLLPALATAQEASSSTSSSTPLAIASSTSSTSEATTAASSTTTTSSAVSSASSLSSSTVTASPSIVTVALDGSGQFSVIGSAISYAQSHSYPTVTVKAGTYSESITIAAAATVTIVGEAGASNSYADNAVTISNSVAAPLTISSTAIKGITFRNINFYNSNAASSAGAVSIKGLQHAFYACQFVTAGSGAVTGGNAVALIADSYMEALDKAVYAYPSLYIYNTVLTVTRSGGLMTYTQGYTYNTILYNSTTVFDSCSVVQKTGYTNSFYLFAANQNGSVAVYRNSTMGSYIAPSGASIDSKTQSPVNAYFEFLNSGAGSYANNAVARAPYVKYVTQASQMSVYEIPSFFSNQYPSVATSSTSWIDKDVLARIQASDAAQDALASAAPASSIASSSSSSVASSSSSSAVSSSVVSSSSSSSSPASSATSSSPIASSSQSSSSADTTSLSSASSTTVSSTVSSASSASATASGCVLPTSVPSTAKTVGPAGSCANYTSIAAAVLDLPSDSSTQYVYILAGTYTEKITISRAGSTIFRGQTDNALSYSANLVTIQTSGAVASSAGGSAATAAFQSTQYNAKSLAFYNINFANTYTATANQIAVAFVAKAQKTGFYGCSFTSSQGALLLNYGAFYFAGSFIQGTTDFIWGQGGAYFYNTKIVTTGSTAGQSIAAQDYQSSYGPSIQVYDSCTIVPSSSSVAKSSTYLGRDYSTSSSTTSSRVVYINSYLDAHIMPVGWKVTSSSVNVTFVEANNTGPGAATSLRSSYAQILSSSSAYTVASVLGDASWLDTAAIAPFSGFPDSVYGTTVSSSSTSSVASSTASSIASSTTSSASSTATVATTAVYTVAPTPTGSQYGSVMSAVAALPADGKPYTISILAGTYTEQVWVNRTGLGKVTLVGETDFPNDFTQNQVTIQFSMGVSTSANSDEITPVINWKRTDGSGLALYNIDFINTYAPSSSTAALAADFYGTNMAAYGCSFKGYQDTLLANQGVQVFSNCYIEGSVDFIWGYSKAYFHQCYIASNTAGACITAQNRPSSTWAGGYVFDSCYVTYTSSYGTTTGTTYLGRPWSQYAVVVYKNSYLDKHIAAAGWKIWSTSSPQTDNVLFGEYNNSGPGAWSSSRASFATNLTDSAAQAYNLESFIGSTSWLDSTAYNYVPSYPLGSSTTPTTTTSPTSSATAVATWAHPTDGTTPPAGAVLVSVGGVEAGSYSNLTIALASLPADSSTQIIFMYPGTYTEQVPAINRAGPVMIIGYTTASPGSSYADNTVTVTYAHGLSVSPLPTGHSDAETATVSTASTKISFYNVNIVNSANLDGSLSSYVTLASSIYGDQIGFYGCSFIGWQDTLLTGNKAGYQYYESCYIEGAIDFIWGYSKAYFKGCTIGAKRAGSAITAQSRASSSAIGGYIFDQCLFTEAPDATVDLTQQVYLGRPYSSYALVVVKNSYLDSIIAPSGWKIWGTSSPNTDHITFAEYNNAGPGNWENNTAARVAWQNCTLLTSDTYPLATVMGSTDWIDMTYWNSIVTPSPAPAAPAAPAASAAPYDGTVPPAGAFIVSKTAIDGVTTYDTVQSALNALPTSSKTTATVFIYPGVYEEQLVLNKSGTTIFMGYSTASDDYSKNQVTISYNEGIDTGSDASNSDSATVYATGNYFQAININFKNTFGTTEDYASLGFAVKSSKYAGLYGCQVYGNQDALLINGYLFAYNTYVEGNVDMIWGAGAAYFLNSTISPNEDKVSLTADKRTDNTTAAGFVFDQCTVTPAAGASFSQISLGRPWNSYARVAFIESYLGSCVEAAGWNAWSSSDPRTSGAMFGEFANYGPGASTSGRASFATQLTATDAAQFQLANFFASTSWINMTLVHTTPFTAANVPTVTSSAVPSVTTVTAVSISTVRANLKVTTTALPVTVTQATTTTLSVGTTITPAATTDIETAKSTSTVTTTSSGTDKTVTSVSTVLVNDAVTVTPALATVTSTVKSTITATSVVTVTAKATTVKSSTTVTSIITSTPKATTVTVSQGTSITVTATVTPGTKKVTSSTTVTAGTGGTTTTTAKATTTTVSVTTTTTSTAKSTTTLTCIPSAAKAKRSVIFGRPDDTPLLAVRATTSAPASGTVTVTVVSYTTTFTATGTTTIPGSTTTTLTQVTKTTGKTTTLKPVTVTDTTVSVVLKTVGTTIPGTTATTTVVTTKTTGKATTLKASTTTVYTTSLATATAKATVTAPGVVTTSVETVTSKATTTLPAQTVTVVKSADTTIKTTVTLATPTSTVWKTATVTLKPSVTVTSQSTVTKTTTVKVKTTVTSVVATKTKAGAVACSAV